MAVPEETEKKARDVNEKTALLKKKSATELGELATSITTIARDAHMEANLEMEIVPQGLRVLIKDDQNRNMFERGSAQIMPFFKTLLVELAPVFDSLDNKIIITGHTDAMAYKNNIYNNWNLSGDRALSARRGVISTANYPARKFGVRSAMPTGMALKLCPHLTLLPGRFDAYKEASNHIREIFSRYTSRIEPLSLDEAYLDVTDSVHCHGSATLIAQEIRQTIFSELQLTASAGVAPVKFLAKIASDMNKPNGQFVITPAEVPAFLQTLPLAKIPGVGKVSAAKLEAMGLRTCGDVQKCDLVILLKRFGKFGRILWERSQGIDERDVNSERLRKSVGVERTMAEDIHHWSECEAIIERLYPELERRLAKVKPDLLIARQGVKLKFDDFQQTTQEHVWPRLNKADLIATARKTWDERRGGRGVRLVGLHVTLLDPQMERQLVLGL